MPVAPLLLQTIGPERAHQEITMQMRRILIPGLTALLLVPVTHADGSSQAQLPADRVIYEGVDSHGRIVRVVISEPGVRATVPAATGPSRYPELHWSAHFGSGKAAEAQRNAH